MGGTIARKRAVSRVNEEQQFLPKLEEEGGGGGRGRQRRPAARHDKVHHHDVLRVNLSPTLPRPTLTPRYDAPGRPSHALRLHVHTERGTHTHARDPRTHTVRDLASAGFLGSGWVGWRRRPASTPDLWYCTVGEIGIRPPICAAIFFGAGFRSFGDNFSAMRSIFTVKPGRFVGD